MHMCIYSSVSRALDKRELLQIIFSSAVFEENIKVLS